MKIHWYVSEHLLIFRFIVLNQFIYRVFLAPEHRLDFNRLMEGRASDPHAWPEPFRRVPGKPARLIEIEPGHAVEANAMPRLLPVRAASLAGEG